VAVVSVDYVWGSLCVGIIICGDLEVFSNVNENKNVKVVHIGDFVPWKSKSSKEIKQKYTNLNRENFIWKFKQNEGQPRVGGGRNGENLFFFY
jgi:hypothetical protein